MLIEEVYLPIVKNVLEQGTRQKDRTSIGESKQTFAQNIIFDTEGRYAPLMQVRTFGPKTSFLEWIWMMSGNTDSIWLEERGVAIWHDNTTREFLDNRGLQHLPVGSIGKSYSKQFRDFGGIDQIRQVFDSLKNNPTSRRHIVSIWNPSEMDEAPLPPCAFLYEFMVEGDVLHIHQHMRSADLILGVPYNLSFAYYFLSSFAQALGMTTGKIWTSMTNCHIYKNHIPLAEKMLETYGDLKPSMTEPSIEYPSEVIPYGNGDLMDILTLEWPDIKVHNFRRGASYGDTTMAK